MHSLDTTIEQRAHGAVAGVVDEDVESTMGRFDFRTQALQGLGVVDVQLSSGKAGRLQARYIFGFTRCGPDLMAGLFETVGQGAANTAGTTCDEDDGHGRSFVSWKSCRAAVRP
ncbi:hypothetical protein D3C72_1605490 [compost metagenome]